MLTVRFLLKLYICVLLSLHTLMHTSAFNLLLFNRFYIVRGGSLYWNVFMYLCIIYRFYTHENIFSLYNHGYCFRNYLACCFAVCLIFIFLNKRHAAIVKAYLNNHIFILVLQFFIYQFINNRFITLGLLNPCSLGNKHEEFLVALD
jgi:hypothetical protein